MATIDPRIKLNHLMYVRYQHENIQKVQDFLLDFGFTIVKASEERIFYRGFGIDPVALISEKADSGGSKFLGGGWAVDELGDLEKASKLPGASDIVDSDAVIGGKMVSLKDPCGGPIYLHWGALIRGQEQIEEPVPLTFNTWDKKRRRGEFQRLPNGPSHIHKLGHYGLEVHFSKYESTVSWYLENFTLLPSDSLYSPETGKDIMVFIHIDRGEEFTDHHSFFISAGEIEGEYEPHHASFEVDDIDSELKGHEWLAKKGWEQCWGVGRHILGSQIFDYWFDPEAFVVEHYADGDVVNRHHKPTRVVASPDAISVWGPDVPLAFLTRKQEDRGKIAGPPPPVAPVSVAAH